MAETVYFGTADSKIYRLEPEAPSEVAEPGTSTLTATPTSANQVDLAWTAATDATSYVVERSVDAGATWTQIAAGLAALAYTDATVAESSTYSYRVQGVNSAGTGAYSNTATVTTPAAPVVTEPIPTPVYPPFTPDEAFAAEHQVVARVDVWRDGIRINTDPLPLTGGRVEIDGSATHRGRVSATIVDETQQLFPMRSQDMLSPYGHELAVYRGAIINGQAQYWPLGIYRIDDSGWEWEEGGTTIHVEGFDRSKAVSDAKTDHVVQFKPGYNFGSAIARLVRIGLPDVVLNFADVNETVKELLVYEDGIDLWTEAQSMAEMIGYELFFDMRGESVLRPIPEATAGTEPAATFRDGEGGNLVAVGSSMSTDPGYNRFVVTSAGLRDAPVRWMSDDKNPDSPTYVFGPYGVRTLKVSDEKVGTIAQARSAARGMVARKLGGTERTRITSWVDPRRDHGEVYRIRAQGVGFDQLVTSERLSFPLEFNGRMEITTKARYTIVEEASQ